MLYLLICLPDPSMSTPPWSNLLMARPGSGFHVRDPDLLATVRFADASRELPELGVEPAPGAFELSTVDC